MPFLYLISFIEMPMLNRCFLIATMFLWSCTRKDNIPLGNPSQALNTFVNPIITGSDPWVTQKDSVYYYTHTQGNRISLWKIAAMSRLGETVPSVVYQPQSGGSHSSNIWAPEMHFLSGKWYIYYTAGSGPDSTQRIWVLENNHPDPLQGSWIDKGRIYNVDSDFWAIDATILQYNGDAYLIWSGRPEISMQQQNLYISRMKNAWELDGVSVMISTPEFIWEKSGGR